MFRACRHIMPNGRRCEAASIRDSFFCYFHARLHTAAASAASVEPVPFPAIEGHESILIALSQVLSSLNAKDADLKRIGLQLYSLQIAAQVVGHVYVKHSDKPVRAVYHTPEGEELANVLFFCEDGDECKGCEKRQVCKDYHPPKEEEDATPEPLPPPKPPQMAIPTPQDRTAEQLVQNTGTSGPQPPIPQAETAYHGLTERPSLCDTNSVPTGRITGP